MPVEVVARDVQVVGVYEDLAAASLTRCVEVRKYFTPLICGHLRRQQDGLDSDEIVDVLEEYSAIYLRHRHH